ncbi:MAG: signaling protein, partial [Bacilli bacterium]|nr:signaling protein [Bacilli bacterium]
MNLSSVHLYVSVNGSDLNDGTINSPFATLCKARLIVRSLNREGHAVTVLVREGTYYLEETLRFSTEDSGTDAAPISYEAYPGEKVVISGGIKLDLQWNIYEGAILKAETPPGMRTDQLFVNGQQLHMARYPNYSPDIHIFNGYAADCLDPERTSRWSDPSGGYIHAMHKHLWGDYHYQFTSRDQEGNLLYEGGWQNNRQMGMHDKYRYVENIAEELDAPGEWFLDEKVNILYVYPDSETDLQCSNLEGVRLPHLIEFIGTQANPVQHISFKGFTFRHAARTFMQNREPLLRSDWTIYRGGSVFFQGAEDCGIEDCHFDQVGGNAVFVNCYNRRITIRGCHISDAGANGVAFVGDPSSVRNPLFEYHQRQKLSEIDTVQGPQHDNYPSDCIVDDCLIYRSGRVEKQSAAVQISMSIGITVRHCSIYDVPRAGINISEGTWGGHVIEHCDVFDTVLETGDHGSFNSWGRDRYWGLMEVNLDELNNEDREERSKLPVLDVVKPIIIRNNRWRCDYG